MTIIRDSTGLCGSILDNINGDYYRVMPLDTTYSLILEIQNLNFTCENHGTTGTPNALLTENCEDVCLGHIDILFVIAAGVQIDDPLSTFNLMISDLEAAFLNSNIPHTVNYKYVHYNWNNFTEVCRNDAYQISSDQNLNDLKVSFGADLLIMIAPPSAYTVGPLACVAEIGPLEQFSAAIVPVDLVLNNHIFVHEFGHLLGGLHSQAVYQVPVAPCAYAYAIFEINRQTIMGIHQPRILHYSDPEVKYYDSGTEQYYPTGGVNFNNAGRLRATGCRVEDFTSSLNINANLTTSASPSCQLVLDAHIDNINTNYTYEWYWNTTGMFLGTNPATYIGSGVQLTINEPVNDPCDKYFIHLKVKLSGGEIASITKSQDGGICTSNVQCNNPVGSKPVLSHKEHFTKKVIDTNTIDEENRTTNYFLYNIFGQPICTFKDQSDIHTNNLSLPTGIYILTEMKGKTWISSKKYFINTSNR